MPPHPDDSGTDRAGAGHYFASADDQTLYRQFGIIAGAVAADARDAVSRRAARKAERRKAEPRRERPQPRWSQ